jgi:hypothetical protein
MAEVVVVVHVAMAVGSMERDTTVSVFVSVSTRFSCISTSATASIHLHTAPRLGPLYQHTVTHVAGQAGHGAAGALVIGYGVGGIHCGCGPVAVERESGL